MFVSGDCGEIIDLNRRSAIDASCQVSVPLARQLQRRLLEIDESETRIACGGDVFNGSGRNKQYLLRTSRRCFPSTFGSFGKAISEEKTFRNWPIRSNNCLWWPCLLTIRDEMSNLSRGPSKDALDQISVHLRKRVRGEYFLQISQSETRNAFGGHVIEDLPFFLLSYGSFGLAVSEKKIFLEIN